MPDHGHLDASYESPPKPSKRLVPQARNDGDARRHPIPDRQVAALLMKGMTAHYLLHRTCAVRPGDTILVHAAAGGMGLILCQWAFEYPLKDAVQTHEALESGTTLGATVLIP